MAEMLMLIVFICFGIGLYKFGYNRGFNKGYDECFLEIIRCKDCIHKVLTDEGEYPPDDIVCDYHMSDGFGENDFCSYGKRKEGEKR